MRARACSGRSSVRRKQEKRICSSAGESNCDQNPNNPHVARSFLSAAFGMTRGPTIGLPLPGNGSGSFVSDGTGGGLGEEEEEDCGAPSGREKNGKEGRDGKEDDDDDDEVC